MSDGNRADRHDDGGVVLVAGAGGVGAAIAAAAAENGPVLLVDRDEATLDRAVRSLPAAHQSQVQTHRGDLLADVAVSDVLSAANAVGQLRGVVHAAGLGPAQTDDGVAILRANLEVFARLAAASAPVMPAGGSVVAVGSVSSRRAHHDADEDLRDPLQSGWLDRWRERAPDAWAAYAYSKRGTVLHAQHLAVEWAGRGLRCNVVAPSQVASPLGQQAIRDDPRIAAYVQRIPMQRMAEPAEVAHVVRFLLSDEASFVTGIEVHVDGGAGAAGASIQL